MSVEMFVSEVDRFEMHWIDSILGMALIVMRLVDEIFVAGVLLMVLLMVHGFYHLVVRRFVNVVLILMMLMMHGLHHLVARGVVRDSSPEAVLMVNFMLVIAILMMKLLFVVLPQFTVERCIFMLSRPEMSIVVM